MAATQQVLSPSVAKEGDFVLVSSPTGIGKNVARIVRAYKVTRATEKRLTLGFAVYGRDGKPVARDARSKLLEPTPENLAAWQNREEEELARKEASEKSKAEWERERNRQADLAVSWLVKQDKETIKEQVGLQDLVDIYEYLTEKNLL